MRLVLTSLALLVAACFMLPDRVYMEAGPNPLADVHVTGDIDEYVFTLGVEYDLQPTQVVIAGQKEGHPWDLGGALGLYDGSAEPSVPVPLVVQDEATRAQVEALAADVAAMRESFAQLGREWDTINRTLLGGGGVGTLLLLLLGGRSILRSRRQSKPDDPE